MFLRLSKDLCTYVYQHLENVVLSHYPLHIKFKNCFYVVVMFNSLMLTEKISDCPDTWSFIHSYLYLLFSQRTFLIPHEFLSPMPKHSPRVWSWALSQRRCRIKFSLCLGFLKLLVLHQTQVPLRRILKARLSWHQWLNGAILFDLPQWLTSLQEGMG